MINPFRLLTLYKRANTLVEDLQDAADRPELYKDQSWWKRVLIAGGALVQAVPLADTERRQMTNWLAKIGMVAGAIVGAAGQFQALPFGPKYSGTIGAIVGIAGIVAGLLHPSPTAQA